MNEAVSSLKTWALGKMAKQSVINLAAAKVALEKEEHERLQGAKDQLVQHHRARRARLWALQIQAECHLMGSLLHIVGAGESWTAMLKMGYRLKRAWGFYQHCRKKLRQLTTEWIAMGGTFDPTENNFTPTTNPSSGSDQSDDEHEWMSTNVSSATASTSLQEKIEELRITRDTAKDGCSFKMLEHRDLYGAAEGVDSIDLRLNEKLILDPDKSIQEDLELSSLRIGLEFGNGAVNLFVSLIPSNYQKAIEVMGVPGERDHGLRLLRKVAATNHPTSPLACLMILHYHCVIMGLLPSTEEHKKAAQAAFDNLLPPWKESSIFRLLQSRLLRYERSLKDAIDVVASLSTNVDSNAFNARSSNQKLNFLVLDELGWCFILQGKFSAAAECFYKLFLETACFKLYYECLQAICLWQSDEKGLQIRAASDLLQRLPDYRVEGQELSPLEQYGLNLADRFIHKNEAPQLPALELASFYNGFQHMDKVTLEHHMQCVEEVLDSNQSNGRSEYELSVPKRNVILCRYLLGVCQKYIGTREKAEEDFRYVIANSGDYSGNVVPYSCYELACMLLEVESTAQEGMHLLEQSLSYPVHEFQARLKFTVWEVFKRYGHQSSSVAAIGLNLRNVSEQFIKVAVNLIRSDTKSK